MCPSLISGMDKLKTLQNDLETAQDALTALQDELPQFHTLLTDNERDAETKKRERASLDVQAQAKNRVMVAREMLEQHRADIATAQADVLKLKKLEHRELTLIQMTEHARTATQHRNVLDKAVTEAVEDLQHAVGTIIREWSAFETAKNAFVSAGAAELGPLQWVSDPASIGLRGEAINQLQTQVLSVLEAVKEQGADVSSLLEGDVVSLKYRTTRPLPAEGLAMLVWSAVLTHGEVPHSLKQRAPKPKRTVYL